MTGVAQPRGTQAPVDTTWHEKARCNDADVDPETFFHPENETGSTKAQRIADAKVICESCPVLAICRDSTLLEQHGIWGGRSEDERAAIRAGNPVGSSKILHIVPVHATPTRTKRVMEPAPVIAHLNTLIDAGFNPTAIGRFIDVSPDTVRAIAKGLKKEVHVATAEKLFSVQVREVSAA